MNIKDNLIGWTKAVLLSFISIIGAAMILDGLFTINIPIFSILPLTNIGLVVIGLLVSGIGYGLNYVFLKEYDISKPIKEPWRKKKGVLN